MLNKKRLHNYLLLSCFILTLGGCAFGSFGKANLTSFDISMPDGLIGQEKIDIIKTLGVPDSHITVANVDYWSYRNKSGFFILLYGSTQEKDLILEFQENKVTTSYLLDKGSSVGVLAPQGAVGN